MPAARPDPEIVLVTGATSGIGAGLAERFHARGAQVILTGRDPQALARTAQRLPGADSVPMNVADPDSISTAMAEIADRHPVLTTLINNAGVQRLLDFAQPQPPAPAQIAEEIATNLNGLINVTAAALPALRQAQRGRVVHIGSGLGFVPLAAAPVYSATKAAVHSFTVSLRHQLADTTIQVIEVVPPVVATELHRDQPHPPPGAMTLHAFLDATMSGLDKGTEQFGVGRARFLIKGARIAPSRFLGLVNRASTA